ncbi:MAG: ANTAR domain-containing protein [Thermoanaerobacterales bacterium]|nr:ANTAR domain-containing protein [Bacillota bacterium]MDI6906043.1 ANTAR domain-containing protein [Thermoanaerobacterales bacterium]
MLQTRVAVAVADETERKSLRDKLVKAGYLVIAQVGEAKEALRVTFEFHPDLLLFDVDLPDFGGLAVPQVVEEHRVAPLVFLVSDPQDVLRYARHQWVFGYVLRPYTDEDLLLAVEVALANFQRLVPLEQENIRMKRQLEGRKLIERAKGLLMEYHGWSEKEAYRFLQRQSMDSARSLTRVAREIIIELERQG